MGESDVGYLHAGLVTWVWAFTLIYLNRKFVPLFRGLGDLGVELSPCCFTALHGGSLS